MNLSMELDAFKHAVSKALDFADSGAYVAEQEAKFKEAIAQSHAYLDERIEQLKDAGVNKTLEDRVAWLETAVLMLLEHVSVPGIALPSDKPALPNPPALPSETAAAVEQTKPADPPPQDDAFVAVGATRFSDGQVQTEESLAAASEAWTAAHPLV